MGGVCGISDSGNSLSLFGGSHNDKKKKLDAKSSFEESSNRDIMDQIEQEEIKEFILYQPEDEQIDSSSRV